jgi:uncharacterized protein (TIGR02118 family)
LIRFMRFTRATRRRGRAAPADRAAVQAARIPARFTSHVVKLVFVIRRREDLPPEEFHRYWLEEHGPLARELLEGLGARRYVQSHTLTTDLQAALAATRGTADAFDGLAEIWWDSLDAMLAASTSDEGRRAGQTLMEDEARFIDFERSSLFLAEEHPILAQ